MVLGYVELATLLGTFENNNKLGVICIILFYLKRS